MLFTMRALQGTRWQFKRPSRKERRRLPSPSN